MRSLLLLLLSFLIPLQLMAATGQSQPQQAMPACLASALADRVDAADAAAMDQVHATQAADADVFPLAGGEVQATPGDAGDEELSSSQGDLEDPTLPTRIATPPAFWQPFPHAFLAPLSWPSYLRDQLRPPPLA